MLDTFEQQVGIYKTDDIKFSGAHIALYLFISDHLLFKYIQAGLMSSDEKETSPVDTAPENNASKRKADVEEIEVDLAAPEPPSKRARRAMKKGKSATSKAKKDNDNEDLEGEETENKDKKDDKTARSEHGVWIGNLRFTVTPQELRQWLIDNSGGVLTTEMITRVKLPTSKTPGRDKSAPPTNKGFAYVDFSDIGGKVAAIALSETEWHGRRLLIKDSTSFEGRPKKEAEAKEDGAEGGREGGRNGGGRGQPAVDPNASRKIFVGNMSFKTTEDDLARNFEKCGEIEWVKIATFEDTGKCKGFGWVKFKEPEAAAWAVKGFVKVKEAIETEDDFRDGNDDDNAEKDGGDDDEDADKEKSKKKKKNGQQQKQFNTRKWYVNRMLGRELKLELAEDDQVRYKKRFGKDRPADAPNGGGQRGPREGGDRRQHRPAKAETAEEMQTARLTGRVVEHTGTKVTFD
ncbi:hypothetical protein PWT90_05795 [Aphanocladium album]|nr:hypothetical protein PWT90_05795 [Aphanocladium album]